MAVIEEDLSIDKFIDLFLAALVLRGKDAISVRGDRAFDETRRMWALYEYLSEVVEAIDCDTKDRDYLYFMVRLRNHVAPDNNGFFGSLRHSILRKMSTIISVDLAWCYTYDITLQRVTAKCWLEQSSDRMRTLAEEAADRYMADLPRWPPMRTEPSVDD